MLQIVQHRKKCIGCNACVEVARSRWCMSKKDGKSILIGGKLKQDIYILNVGLDEYDINTRAAANCPVKIIKIKVL